MADRPPGAGEKKRPALLQAAFFSGADGRNQIVDLLIANLPAELYKSVDQVGEIAPQFKKPTVQFPDRNPRGKSIMSHKSIFICLLAIFLTACAVSYVDRDFSLENNPDEGIVIVSVSFDRAGSRNFQAMFYLDEGIPGAPVPPRRLEALPEYATIRMGSQFKDSYGQVLAISLPAGRHTISSWRLVRNAGYILSPSAKMAPLEFHVAAGKVQYIGNLHLNLAEGKTSLALR